MPCEFRDSTDAGCLCIGSGTISCMMRLNKLLYVPGESIIIYAEITNNSDSKIKFTEAVLKQVCFV